MLRTVLVVGLNSLSLPLSLHSAVAGGRRTSANAIPLTSSTFTSSSFVTAVSSSSSASSSSAAARPSCATAKQALHAVDRWQGQTSRRQPRLPRRKLVVVVVVVVVVDAVVVVVVPVVVIEVSVGLLKAFYAFQYVPLVCLSLP